MGVVDRHRCGGPSQVWWMDTGVADRHRCGGWTQVWRTITGVVDCHGVGIRVAVQLCSRRPCPDCEPSTSQGRDLARDVPSELEVYTCPYNTHSHSCYYCVSLTCIQNRF